MLKQDGYEPQVSGWTGLWLVPGAILIIPGDRLVREGAGSSEQVLGGESPGGGSHRLIRALLRWLWRDEPERFLAPRAPV